MLARLEQELNASFPILVTLSGMVMLARLVQERNAEFPILVTPSGMVMLARLLQRKNASSPIIVTPLGMVTLVTVEFPSPKMEEYCPTLTTEISFITAGMSTAPPAPE